eukprot:Phypoly_transcript_12629.p1 GENE.Phypoly_transcript_12629~~Phypoly_transcript_12629.p1  ORF type:complete len:109 (-),score=11.78 Phypoly_transcript_12629:679-1005(-)
MSLDLTCSYVIVLQVEKLTEEIFVGFDSGCGIICQRRYLYFRKIEFWDFGEERKGREGVRELGMLHHECCILEALGVEGIFGGFLSEVVVTLLIPLVCERMCSLYSKK